jgi:hypothetical protein
MTDEPMLSLICTQREQSMSDDPKDVIEAAIRSAFDSYPKEDDPARIGISSKECSHLTLAVILGLDAKGFQIVRKATR